MKRATLFSLLTVCCIALTSGCKAQQAVSPSENAVITWTQSTSCTTATPCQSYAISRAAVVSATTACPATTSTAYTLVLTVSTANATTGTDTTVPSTGYYCWTVQPVQNSLTGPASSPMTSAFEMTEPPLAPGTPTVTETAADLVIPAGLRPQPAPAPVLSASLASVGPVTVRLVAR